MSVFLGGVSGLPLVGSTLGFPSSTCDTDQGLGVETPVPRRLVSLRLLPRVPRRLGPLRRRLQQPHRYLVTMISYPGKL